MYLLAKEIPKSNLFTNWKGREGKFVRTFGMNSQRNNNEWRATWESIKKYIHTSLQFPGIEYEVCRAEGCDLDHVEADTFEENVEKQKPFHRTKIIDYILNEEEESVDLIHEVENDEFWEKLQKREIKYVSPLIWPLAHGVKILGRGRVGLPIIDTNAWKFVHHAFLKTKPAYGADTATVKTMCEGKDCDIKLLAGKEEEESPKCGNCEFFVENNTCKLVKGEIKYEDVCDLHSFGETQPKDTPVDPTHEKSKVNYRLASPAKMSAVTTISNQDNISHLQEIPLLYKHKGQLILLSASECVQKIIKKKKDAGITIDDEALAIAYSECGESKGKKAKSSFKTCSCSARQKKMADDNDHKRMAAMEKENHDLKSKLKAQEQKDEKDKSHEARKGRYAKLFANTEDKEREKMVASLRANDDDKDDLKAAMEVDEDMKSKKANNEDPEKEHMKARLSALEAKEKDSMIKNLVALKSNHGLGAKEVNEYHASLKGKTHDEILSKFDDNQFEINSMKASITPETEDFVFNGMSDVTGLKGKTFDQIAEVTA